MTSYTSPLLDTGRRNFTEKTIDFLCFGWHFTKASIYRNYLKNKVEANKELWKAGWYRKKYLIKRFGINGSDLTLALEKYKNLNITPILEDLYIFLMRKKNTNISLLREDGEKFIIFKNWEMATEAFSKVIDSNPNDHMSYYHLGLSCLHLKKLKKANEYFERAIELKPSFADAYYRLGFIAEKEENWRKAQSFYEKAINLVPNHLDSLKALKKINEKLK